MKKFITLVAMIALATGGFALARTPAKDCGGKTCNKKTVVKEAAACCTTDGSCKKEASSCTKKAGACSKKAATKKAGCTGGTCPLSK